MPQLLPSGFLQDQRPAYHLLWPQRWSFFADAADTDVVVAYRVGPAGELIAEPAQLHQTRANLWGLRRTSDSVQAELGPITDRLPEPAWTPCAAPDVASCPLTRPYDLVNEHPAARLCGLVRLAVLGPEAGSRGPDPAGSGRRPRAVALVRLGCPAGVTPR